MKAYIVHDLKKEVVIGMFCCPNEMVTSELMDTAWRLCNFDYVFDKRIEDGLYMMSGCFFQANNLADGVMNTNLFLEDTDHMQEGLSYMRINGIERINFGSYKSAVKFYNNGL